MKSNDIRNDFRLIDAMEIIKDSIQQFVYYAESHNISSAKGFTVIIDLSQTISTQIRAIDIALADYFGGQAGYKSQADITQLNQWIDKLSQENSDLKQKYQLLNQNNEKLRNENVRLKQQQATVSTNTHLESKINRLTEEIKKLNAEITRLNGEKENLQYSTTAISKSLQAKINKLENENTKLNQKLIKQDQTTFNTHLQDQFTKALSDKESLATQLASKTELLNKLYSRCQTLQEDNQAKENTITQQAATITSNKSIIAQLKQKIASLEEQLKKQSDKTQTGIVSPPKPSPTSPIDRGPEPVSPLRPGPIDTGKEPPAPIPVIVEPSPEAEANPFAIAKTAAPLRGSLEQMQKFVSGSLANMAELKNFLQNSSYSRAGAYLQTLGRQERDLNKLLQKFANFEEIDEDLRSEEITEKFFKVFAKNILSNMMVGIFHGIKENPEFYQPFLKLLNGWLRQSGIYTRTLYAGNPVADDDWIEIDPIPSYTDDEALHNVIKVVERLPYFIDYLDSDGKTEKFCHNGKVIVYSTEDNDE